MQGWGDPDDYERLHGAPGYRRRVTGSAHVQWDSAWLWGWIAMVIGYVLQWAGVLRPADVIHCKRSPQLNAKCESSIKVSEMLMTLAAIWSLSLGVGSGIDLLVFKTAARVTIHRALRDTWIRLRCYTIPDLPKIVGNAALVAMPPLIVITKKSCKKNGRKIVIGWRTLYISIIASLVLTSIAWVFYCNLFVSRLEDTVELIFGFKFVWFMFVTQTYPFIGLYMVNVFFDVITIFVTLHIIQQIVLRNNIVGTALIFVDLFIGTILALGVLFAGGAICIAGGMVPADKTHGIYESIVGVVRGGMWIIAPSEFPKGAVDGSAFLYSSTTLIPTATFIISILVSIMAKAIAESGQWVTIHLLGVARERSPQTLPAGAMLGALIASIITIYVVIFRAISLIFS